MDRKKYSADEAFYPELVVLLDTYEISDSLSLAHLHEVGPPACRKGCSNCCKSPTVPFTEPELIGISWYATVQLAGLLREQVKQRLYRHRATLECAFLVDNECSIYEVRPLACRQLFVKNRACEPDEVIVADRPDDIIAPIESIATASFMRLLDFWPYESTDEKKAALENGVVQYLTAFMHDYDWVELAKTMDAYDRKM